MTSLFVPYSVLFSCSTLSSFRSRLCGQTAHNPITTKKERNFRSSPSVSLVVLFSSAFLRDLSCLCSLRDIAPDPNNLPWVERSQQVWAERREAITIIDCLGLTDDGWKFIFKDNHRSKTKDCDSNNRWPKTTQPHRHRLTAPAKGKRKKRKISSSSFSYPEPGSNRHRGEPTGVWDQRVYRFRHLGFCEHLLRVVCGAKV